MPWLFLVVTLIGAWFTFNAYIPQRRTGPLVVPSFFAGWLTSELSAHHFAWQLAATLTISFYIDPTPYWRRTPRVCLLPISATQLFRSI